jgi:hypothetical protein
MLPGLAATVATNGYEGTMQPEHALRPAQEYVWMNQGTERKGDFVTGKHGRT